MDDQLADNSVLVIILSGETKSCDSNIANLQWVFSDPYFVTQVLAVAPPPPVPATKTLSQSQYNENYIMRKALLYASEGPYVDGVPQYAWSRLPVLIVKDNSVSNITPSGITDFAHNIRSNDVISGMRGRISTALQKAQQADLFYLCHWDDLCNKLTDVSGVTGSIDHGSTLKWSIQPTSTQAIMYPPSTRDFVINTLINASVSLATFLNDEISQGNLLAVTFVPNLIDFDITIATSSSDYLKLNECSTASTSSSSSSSNSNVSVVWFVVIIVLIVLIAWALIQLGPQYAKA